jgi:hypothetical protein
MVGLLRSKSTKQRLTGCGAGRQRRREKTSREHTEHHNGANGRKWQPPAAFDERGDACDTGRGGPNRESRDQEQSTFGQ